MRETSLKRKHEEFSIEQISSSEESRLDNLRHLVTSNSQRNVETRSNPELVVESPLMQRLYRQAATAAAGTLPILILGETGTGKELVAAAIHRASPRSDQPLVALNCAAIPPTLLESAFFGHERGAFTGAAERSLGIFERACGGMLFLDEIGELPAAAQAALLRAVETQKICRLGSTTEIRIDVRIVAATHCDLPAMIEHKGFRRDLYYRLSAVELEVPALRARPEEIAPLARFFLAKVRAERRSGPQAIAPEAMQVLEDYPWPGNVRQLRHAIERASLLATQNAITVDDLPQHLFAIGTNGSASAGNASSIVGEGLGLREQLRRYERTLIEDALRRAGHDRRRAAKLLGIGRRTLYRKLGR